MRFLRRRREPQADFAQASPRNLYLRSRGDAPLQTRLSRENHHRPAEAICAIITQSAIPVGRLPPTLERRDYRKDAGAKGKRLANPPILPSPHFVRDTPPLGCYCPWGDRSEEHT